ncbi:alanyl-tRNA editing protein [Pseudomonas sp. NPDC089392]|uniref:alanyl-tRNA editing protein n=1 Tax=Pseudomonas sp. NPDC089392 TaxID=3364459 RepID=UPI0038070712
MTQRLYFDRDDLAMQTKVLSCSPAEEGNFHVILDATLFHPQGGGQPSDQGTINGVEVLRVFQDGANLVHLTVAPVAVGNAEIEVRAAARSLHARLHSAGHLLATSMEPLGWVATKGHHWPGEARVVFERTSRAQAVEAPLVEQAVNELVQTNSPRRISVEDGMRTIGFGTMDMSACGGTHVASTAEVGHIRIVKMKEKKGQLSVQYEVEA